MSTVTYLACAPTHSERPAAQVAREALGRLVDLLVEQGRFALHQLRHASARSSTEVRALLDAGYLRATPDGQVELTPGAVRACEEAMLLDLLRGSGPATLGLHARAGSGSGPEAGDEARPHRPGDPLEHVDATATLGQALRRGLPLELREEDVVVRPAAGGRCCTVLLLDLSGSMARHGKFSAARRAALALRALIRRRFPGDELITAGFASRAVLLPGRALVESTPRSVGLFDPRLAEHRLPVDAAGVPEHFTNIQAGLRLARRCLRGKSHALRQVVLITDGEPTAHVEGGGAGAGLPADGEDDTLDPGGGPPLRP